MSLQREEPSRYVWVFARPLSWAAVLGLQWVSSGKYPLCHWGLLVTRLEFSTVKSALLADNLDSNLQDFELGTMWELRREEGTHITVEVTRPFKATHARGLWATLQAERIGTTKKSDRQIQQEGRQFLK